MRVTVTLLRLCPGGKRYPFTGDIIERPETDFAPPIIEIPDGLSDPAARRAAATAVIGRHRRQLGTEVARLAGRHGDFGSITAVNRHLLLWTVYATDGDTLGTLEGHISPPPLPRSSESTTYAIPAAARRGTTDREAALTERPYQEIVDHAVTRGEAALRGWVSAPRNDHTPAGIADGDYTPPQAISDAVTDLLHLAARTVSPRRRSSAAA